MQTTKPHLAALLALAASACAHTDPAPPLSTTSATVAPQDLASLVGLQEFPITKPNALVERVAIGPDNVVWVTERNANAIGRLERPSGGFHHYPLMTPDSQPLGIAVARNGHVWFTANAKGYLGDLDPMTGDIVESYLPDAHASDPDAIAIAPDDKVWFTLPRGGGVGTYDPETKAFTLRPLKDEGMQPLALALGKDGGAYVAVRASDRILRFDSSQTGVREYGLPQGAHPGALVLAPDGAFFYTDEVRGRIGRLDPATGLANEWPSPSGPRSQPHAIAVMPDGMVWYNEAAPSMLVRFDPMTGRFASMRIPSSGVVRSMAATPAGLLYLAVHGKAIDRVLRIEPLAIIR